MALRAPASAACWISLDCSRFAAAASASAAAVMVSVCVASVTALAAASQRQPRTVQAPMEPTVSAMAAMRAVSCRGIIGQLGRGLGFLESAQP